jgi:hypothetical protein
MMADLAGQDVPVDVPDDVRVARLTSVSGILVLVLRPDVKKLFFSFVTLNPRSKLECFYLSSMFKVRITDFRN